MQSAQAQAKNLSKEKDFRKNTESSHKFDVMAREPVTATHASSVLSSCMATFLHPHGDIVLVSRSRRSMCLT